MSRIGKIPVLIKQGVEVFIDGNSVKVKGAKGSLEFAIPKNIKVALGDDKVTVSQNKEFAEETKEVYGLTRAYIANMIKGVSDGFEKKLELSGVGYRAQGAGKELTLSLGFSHPLKVMAPEGITFSTADNIITVSGIDKTLVGDTAAKIRAIRPPEPYKGKGVRYLGEKIRRKAGKAAKAIGAK